LELSQTVQRHMNRKQPVLPCGNCSSDESRFLKRKPQRPARRPRVRAPFRAALFRRSLPFVRDACRAERLRATAPRRRALVRACEAKAPGDADLVLSLFRAWVTARDRFRDGARPPRRPRWRSFSACFRVSVEALPFFGGGSFIPARRALERPMAIACLADLAPCFPSRTWSISSRTNSPAWVDGALPSRASSRARSSVSFSGMLSS
jgi:hypothetical protein